MLVVFLQLEGHEVEQAASGDEALDLLAERNYDVILSDFRMPDMDGDELYQHIGRRWPHLAPRVILATADGHVRFGGQGGDRLVPKLTKPYTMDRLREAIAQVVARFR